MQPLLEPGHRDPEYRAAHHVWHPVRGPLVSDEACHAHLVASFTHRTADRFKRRASSAARRPQPVAASTRRRRRRSRVLACLHVQRGRWRPSCRGYPLPIDPETNNCSRGAGLRCSGRHSGHDCARCRTDHKRQTRSPHAEGWGCRCDDLARQPSGGSRNEPRRHQIYVIAADSVEVVSRLHHIVGTYRIGPHPKRILVSDDGTRVYVTGYDGSTSVINTANHRVNTFALERSIAEVVISISALKRPGMPKCVPITEW